VDAEGIAENSEHVEEVPAVQVMCAVIREKADSDMCTSFLREEALHVYYVAGTGIHAESEVAARRGQDTYISGFR
jgi:hypothetical protein